jgi:S1-C subfamily serine protease
MEMDEKNISENEINVESSETQNTDDVEISISQNSEMPEPAPVDYSSAAGQRESIRPSHTMAYNTSDTDSSESAFTEEDEEPSIKFTEPESLHEDDKPIKKRKSLSKNAKSFIAAVLGILLCVAAGFGGGAVAVNCLSPSASGGSQTIKIDASDAESLNAASAIAKKVMPSVVGISTVSQTYTQTIFGLQQGTQQGVGTGIIVTEDGYILTNSHVVNDGDSQSITVDLYDGSEYTGTVLWNSTDLDLAIVKIDATGLTAADLGDSDDVEIGDYAVAIGNPLGLDFERSVTQGIISGLDRTITTTDSSTGSQNTMEGLIQTDASINSGNSGGPLINSDGEVIGINSAKASSAEGLGFSIPINTAMPIIQEIKESGTYEQTYIGISGMNVESVIAKYQTDFNADEGIYIVQIYTNSPASKAGLQEGDIITEIDGNEVEDMSDLKKELVKYRPGDKVKVTFERDKKTQTVEVTLEAASESSQQTLQPAEESQDSSSSDGSSGTTINPYDFFGNFLN